MGLDLQPDRFTVGLAGHCLYELCSPALFARSTICMHNLPEQDTIPT